MKDNNTKIEQRLENLKKFYLKTGEFLDNLPDAIPGKIKTMLKDRILGDKDLKKLIESVDTHRPPRIFMIGRTGVGKSSLINALRGAYVARVSDTVSCTETATSYTCMDGDRVLMEILDTRGIAESESLNDKTSAEDMLIKQINEFSPDVAIMMLNCTHRDDIISDIEFMKKVTKEYASINKINLPIVVVVNKCDEMAPSRHKNPEQYPPSKIEKIQEVVRYYKGIIVKNGLKIEDIVPVASLIDWQTPDGMEVDVHDIENLPNGDIENIEIAFDGRYGMEELCDLLTEAILDVDAQMGLRMAVRLNHVVKNIANHITKVFAGISAGVALSPIPMSDIYILLTLQSILVTLIASLSGREVSFETGKEFIFSMGGIGIAGYGLKITAQQATKLFNAIIPVTGSAVSSTIAFSGTFSIGKAAIAYYIDDKDINIAQKLIKKIFMKSNNAETDNTGTESNNEQ